jgi:hypothetical protein
MVADAAVVSANAAGANASPPQAVTVANTAAATMRSLLFCFKFTSPFVGAETPSSYLRDPASPQAVDRQFLQVSQVLLLGFHMHLSDWIVTAVIYRDSAISLS